MDSNFIMTILNDNYINGLEQYMIDKKNICDKDKGEITNHLKDLFLLLAKYKTTDKQLSGNDLCHFLQYHDNTYVFEFNGINFSCEKYNEQLYIDSITSSVFRTFQLLETDVLIKPIEYEKLKIYLKEIILNPNMTKETLNEEKSK